MKTKMKLLIAAVCLLSANIAFSQHLTPQDGTYKFSNNKLIVIVKDGKPENIYKDSVSEANKLKDIQFRFFTYSDEGLSHANDYITDRISKLYSCVQSGVFESTDGKGTKYYAAAFTKKKKNCWYLSK